MRVRIGAPIASESLFPAASSDPDLAKAYSRVQSEVQALVVFPRFDPSEVIDLASAGEYLPAGVKAVKVRLVGTLPGSDYRRILSSDTLGIEVK